MYVLGTLQDTLPNVIVVDVTCLHRVHRIVWADLGNINRVLQVTYAQIICQIHLCLHAKADICGYQSLTMSEMARNGK